ncbi:MAG: ATP-binding protein [Bryobacteraceae bacterium]|jgi:nitrogen fixation/metabolism regulation signal transduction histidine kinase
MAARRPSARKRWLTFERRLYVLALGAGLPGLITAIVLLYMGNFSSGTRWMAIVLMTMIWLGFAGAVRERAAYSMRTLANLLGALRDGDFSIRLRMEDRGSLGDVYAQLNDMAETLHEQRLGAMEATALLQKVISEIDVSIFAFDSAGLLRLINKSGEHLIQRSAAQAIGESAEQLGLAPHLTGPVSSVTRAAFRGGAGLWSVRRGDFRESGQPHQLLVLADITRPLREEELHAWQRLVRVLGHEINNSLTPVKSLSSSLLSLVAHDPLPLDWRDDVRSGLNVISNRCEALNRFTGAYARLARLPEPKLQPVRVADWIGRVARLEQRLPVRVIAGPDIAIRADADQLDQLLINILRNAVDATIERHGEAGGGVSVEWCEDHASVEIRVDDEGHGIANPGNLFVPFFTTKPGGSGIGLFLSRQIAEAHAGTIALKNRTPGPGCRAVIALPL